MRSLAQSIAYLADTDVNVWIRSLRPAIWLLGQSNSTGHGVATSVTLADGFDQVFSPVQQYVWWAPSPTDPPVPLTFGPSGLQPRSRSGSNMGSSMSMVRYLNIANPGKYCVIETAIDGAGLDACIKPGSGYPSSGGDLITQWCAIVSQQLVAMNAFLACVVFVGCEADAAGAGPAGAVSANLTSLFSFIRTQFNNPTLPVVVSRLHTGTSGSFTATVQTQEDSWVSGATNATLVNPDSAALQGDNTHYTSDGYVTLGNLLGPAVLTATGVKTPPQPIFGTTISGLNVTFTNKSIGRDAAIVSHFWDAGDGTTSTSASWSHTYAVDGLYTIKLTETDANGISATTTQSIRISVPVDGPAMVYVPRAAADFTNLGLPSPTALWKCDEASPNNLVDVVNSIALAPNATPLYQQAISLWTAAFVGSADGTAGQAFRTTSALLDTSANRSVAFLWYLAWTTGTANRVMAVSAGSQNQLQSASSVGKVSSLHSNVVVTSTLQHYSPGMTTVRPYLWYKNKTANKVGLLTNIESLVGTPEFATNYAGTFKDVGPSTATASPTIRCCLMAGWVDAAAEAIAQASTLTTLRWPSFP